LSLAWVAQELYFDRFVSEGEFAEESHGLVERIS
jgi:hypothetical protein